MSARRQRTECRAIDVDGSPVLIRGRGEPTEADLAAIREVARAAQALAAGLPPICGHRDDGSIIPCTRGPEHEPPHRSRSGREW